jgi:hypothetical protein
MPARFHLNHEARPRALDTTLSPHRDSCSAEQVLHRLIKDLVARMHVYLRAQDRFVASKSLRNQDVFRALVNARYGAMPQAVKMKRPVEPGALLPLLECVSHLPRGKTIVFAAHKQRCILCEGLSLLTLPSIKLFQLCPYCPRQNNLLCQQIGIAPLEYTQLYPSSGIASRIEDISDVESENLVLAQSCTERDGEDHMIPIPIPSQTSNLEKKTLLSVRKCHDPQGIAAKVGKRDRASGAVMARCFVG